MKYSISLLFIFICRMSFGQDRIIVCTGSNEIIVFNFNNCNSTLLGYSSDIFHDIAFTPDGKLWGVNEGGLFKIDTINGNDEFIGSTPNFEPVSLVAYNNDTLLGEYLAWLWGIRVSDGFAWPIDSIGYYATGDLTWFDGKLYMTAIGNPTQLIRMEVSSDLDQVSNVEVVGSLASGQGQWFGANTVLTDSCTLEKTILGFDGPDVYRISPIDASVSLICPDAFPNGTFGATSLGEQRSNSGPGMITMPNVFSPNGTGSNELFRPIDPGDSYEWSLKVFNRWGQLVYDSNSTEAPWDGRTAAGDACSEGIYFYLVSYGNACKPSTTRSGQVSLLR